LIQHLSEAIHQQLSNPFMSGGLLLMFTGSIIAFARNLPMRAWGRIREQFIVEVYVQNTDPLFDWISLWLNDQPYSKKTRRLSATTIANYEGGYGNSECQETPIGYNDERPRPKLILTPAKGMHLLRYRGTLLWLSRGAGDSPTDNSGGSKGISTNRFQLETWNLRIFGRSQSLLRDLLNEVIDRAVSFQEKKISAFVGIYSNWRRLRTFTPRKLDSVIVPEADLSKITKTLEEFIQQESWYTDMGIPYHLGMLFHGTAGSGKTSLIGALAGHFKMNLYLLNLASEDIDDERFASLISEIPPRSFMVLEDIDGALGAHKRSADKEGHKGLTLTGLLNSLDGFMAKDGSIVFMTTNHRELLDPALLRPGRVDVEIEFKPATSDQRERLFKRFFPEASELLAIGFGAREDLRTMAEAQQVLLAHKDDPRSAALLSSREEYDRVELGGKA